MDVTPLIAKGQQIVQKYAGGVFKISGVVYPHPVILAPDSTVRWDIAEGQDVSGLTVSDFKGLLGRKDQFDVFLLGCGTRMEFLPAPLKRELKALGLSVDTMDTGAACRTYNVLMAEGRRVIAALLPA